MLVKVLNFGCNWWARFGSNPADPYRYTHNAAYYNSTGIRCSCKVRRHWIVPGLVRFNGADDFNPHYPARAVNSTFLASDLDFLFGGNRLLFKKKMPDSRPPDCYLVVVSQELHGRIDLTTNQWRSSEAVVIAASQLRQTQEAMLLMKPGDWVKTACGFWQLSFSTQSQFGAGLVLLEDQVLA